MTRDELQLVADAVWITIGIDNFGVTIHSNDINGFITVGVVGFDAGQMYAFNETFTRHSVECMPGQDRYNYMREIARCCRKAITDFRTAQIKQNLNS